MTPPLGDVVARARGLACHLLPETTLVTLVEARGSGALADALAQVGYPRVSDGAALLSTVEMVDASIERESARRLGVLARWLGSRRALFAGVFEDEERRVLRILLRRVAAARSPASARPRTDALVSLSRRAREELASAADVPAFVRVLGWAGSPYAAPLEESLRAGDARLVALEEALDRVFARRARSAARRAGGHLLAWVTDGIDLENAWGVLLGGGAFFIEGGERLSRDRRDAIAREPSEPARRAELARVFAADSLGAVFGDAAAPLAGLESRARHARLGGLRRAARLDPLGPAALLELLMRLREETVRLRRIAWAVAQGMAAAALVDARVEPAP